MSDPERMLKVLETHTIKCALGLDRDGIRGGLIVGGEYAWFTNGADIVLYSKTTGCVESSRSFGQTDSSMEITFVQELHKSEKTINMLLVGCSCKSFGILFVCQLPSLSIIRCIHTPSPISYISTINNESLAQDQLCNELKVMSTVLLVGMITGAVFAVDLRQCHIENQLKSNKIVVNESSPSKLFFLRKNKDNQEAKKISDDSDFHLAMFINENVYNFNNKQCSDKLNVGISCLLYTEEINAVAIGYVTGHFQLWDCKTMQTLYVLKKPEFFMPISHITFLEQADDPHKLCYFWIIQSDNSRLPNAMMIALSYEHRTLMSNGRFSYRVYKDYNIKLKMSLQKDSGIGRCISALTLCNDNLVRKSTDMSENCGITLFTMLMEFRQNVDASPKSYVFLFDINQWYKAKMPSVINHLKISKPYASFVKLPDYATYLDFNISDKTLRPFGSNFRNNVKNLFYPSSIYFECDCLSDTKIIRFKHVGVQQEVLDTLIFKNWSLFLNPNLIFHQCLQKNVKPFFWDKTYDYENYSLLDKLHFVISIIVENNMMSVIDECAEKWKNGTHSEVIILHLVKCLWNHVMLVKQYADQLCIPLFDCSGMLDGKESVRMLNDCLSQMLLIENFFKRMQLTDCSQITNVDLADRVKIINLVTQYFAAIIYFVNFQLLPKQIEEDATHQIIQCDFTSLIQYACKRRMEFGDLPLYLIDAIVTNEPNGNKLIEQWKHECIEETKGLYPPSDIQCLLRIYLNAELSNQIKDFITIYFLIDVCSVQKMDEMTANIFNDTFVKNEELYKLCCASWLFDHDMFEDAMLILASNNEWIVNDKSWNWYHWTVLKLFVFKKQYYWAQIYLELFNIKLINLDDHKFYVNLQIMNNHCFDALCHLQLRKIEDKKILFEYIFDRCRHTNQLKAFLSYPMDSDEKQLFFSCLKKCEDTNLIQFMFLVQEKRYSEALEVYKLLKIKTNSKHDYVFTIASVLVDKIKDNISPNNKSDTNKRVFSDEEIKMTFANCFMDNHINIKKSNIFRSYGKLCQNNLIVPDNDDIVSTTQGFDEKVSAINGVLSPLKIETVKQIEKKLLKLLDTPFIQNVSYIHSATNCLAVPKKKSETDNKLKVDSENKFVGNSETHDLPIDKITEQTLITPFKLLKDNSEIELLEIVPISHTVNREEYEKLDISDSDQSGIPNSGNEVNIEEPDIILSDLDDTNNSEQPDDLLDDNLSVENTSNETSIMSDDENEDNLKELDIILEDLNDSNNSEQSDIQLEGDIDENFEESDDLLDDNLSVENTSNETSIMSDDENEDNLKELDIILEDLNGTDNSGKSDDLPDDDVNVENNLEEPNIILSDLDASNNLIQSDDLLDDNLSVENTSNETSIMSDDENEDNLKELDIILEDLNDSNNSEQSDIQLEGDIDENFEESDDLLDDNLSVENTSNETSIMSDDENEDNLKELDIILEDLNGTDNSGKSDDLPDDDVNVENNLEEPNIILSDLDASNNSIQSDDLLDDNLSVENTSNETSIMSDDENEDNLKELDIILEDLNDNNSSKQHDIKLEGDIGENLKKPDIILHDSNSTNNSGKSDDLPDDDVNVENNSDQLNVLPDDENEDNLEKPNILEGEIDIHFEESEDLLDDEQNIKNYSDQISVILDDDVNVESDQPYAILDDKNEDNVEVSEMILDDANGINYLEQLDIILEGEIDRHFEESEDLLDVKNEENLEKSDFILEDENYEIANKTDFILDDDVNVENRSDQPSVSPDGGNKDDLEKPNAISEVNIEVPEMNDTNNSEQPDIILENDINENLEESDDFLDDDQNVEHDSDQPIVLPDDVNGTINLKQPDIILEGENYVNVNKTDSILDDDVNVENRSDQPSVSPDGGNKDDLEKPNAISEVNIEVPEMNDTNNSEQPDVILENDINENLEESDDFLDDDQNVEHDSDQPIVLPDDVNGTINLKQPDIILEGENYENVNKTDSILDDDVNVENQSHQPSVLPDGEVKGNLGKPYPISEVENEENVEVPEMILDNTNDTNNSEQLDVILEGNIVEHFEESDDFLDDDQNVGNQSDQPSVLPYGGNKNNLEKPYIIPEGKNKDNLLESDNLLNAVSVEHDSDQPIVLPDGENYGNTDETDIILDDANVQNHSDQLSVKPDGEYKENSEETYASEKNLTKLFKTLKNEKTSKNNEIVECDNVVYLTDSQSNALKNLTPNYCLTEENRLNCDNQIIEEENKNNICNIVDGNKSLFVIKKDDIAEIVENTNKDNKSSEPINFQIVENPKDLCNDQSDDYLYDEYQYSNNDIFSELSTIENPIPEYGFNHLTMTENESNQLEVYDTLNQPTSVLLNESFLNNISLGTTAEVNETCDLVVNNGVKIVTDKISVDLEPSSSNINLYNQEIKSFQLVDSKDIASHQVDINIFNSATQECAVEIQNSCAPAIISEPSKTLIIEEFPSNSMFHKDILVQEGTSKMVNFVKNSSDTENVYNLRTVEKNKQPLIEQVDKNIFNLRKRRSRAKCIPSTDTKLTTKSKSESKTNQVELEIISSNVSFPTSDIFEDSLVSVSKKRSKCQKKSVLVKRRRVGPKYVASVDGASNSKIDLEQSEEITTNKHKKVKKIKELLPNNFPNKNKVTSQKKLKKLDMPTEIKLDSKNNKILNRNTIFSTKHFEHLFFMEPKIVLERFDVSSYKNCFKQLAVPNDSSLVTLSTYKPNSQKPVALKRLRNGCLKSIKEPTTINTIIDLDEELKKDSIINDKKKTVTKKSKLNTSYKKKKIELDKNLKSDPKNCVNKIHNNLINKTIDLISDHEFVSDEVQEEMGQTKLDKEKLDWRIISHEIKTNTDAIPKIRIGRNKSELNTKCVGSLLDLESMKRGTKIIQEQELGFIKKSSETKLVNLNQQGRRMSSRKILKKLTCSCCTSKSMDVACHSNVLG